MDEARRRPKLSDREQQLITLAAQGLTDTAIAQRLGISEATVNTYWGRVRIKLGPLSRTELVANALKEESEQAIAALREENLKLLEQLREAPESPAELESNFKQMLESAPDALLAVGGDAVIRFANAEASQLFGYEEGELNGKILTTIIPERYHNIHRQHVAAYFENPSKRRMGAHLATMAVRKDGSELRIAAALNAFESSRGMLAICSVRPVDEREALARFIAGPQSDRSG